MCGLMVNEKRESATPVKTLYVKVDEALDETIKRFWVMKHLEHQTTLVSCRKFGQDGITRRVKLKTAAGMMKQPTMNLHLIEPLRIKGWEYTTPMGGEDSNNKRKDSVVDAWNLMISTVELKKNEKKKNIGRLIGRNILKYQLPSN
ncbi:hypothetical protein TSPI_00183 [Trichinella spiralis]|uniref:PiggyBac transposable element-derived protein domain-containing protein n=1 Tax=Trichinella spiralis TaxID=6334 RepID=A0ABR3KQ84_TRISP